MFFGDWGWTHFAFVKMLLILAPHSISDHNDFTFSKKKKKNSRYPVMGNIWVKKMYNTTYAGGQIWDNWCIFRLTFPELNACSASKCTLTLAIEPFFKLVCSEPVLSVLSGQWPEVEHYWISMFPKLPWCILFHALCFVSFHLITHMDPFLYSLLGGGRWRKKITMPVTVTSRHQFINSTGLTVHWFSEYRKVKKNIFFWNEKRRSKQEF